MKKKIGYVVCVALIIWLFASFVDVNLHNQTSMQYAWWNIFEIIW